MRRLLFSILAVFTAATSWGQLSFGVRAGFGSYGADFEPPSLTRNQVPLYEPSFGFVGIFNDKSNAGVQVEVNYAIKGWHERDKDDSNMEYKRELSYLEIPVMTHFEIGRSWFRVYGLIGPYIAFKQSEKETIKNYDEYIYFSPNDLYHQKVRDIDFGNKVGLGFRINFCTRFSFFPDVRYDLEVAGGQNNFKKQPNGIQASRLTELGGSIGLVFNLRSQKTTEEKEYYVPKEGINDGMDY